MPHDAPSQALKWACEALASASTLGIVGVFPLAALTFSIGMAMDRNLTVNIGNSIPGATCQC